MKICTTLILTLLLSTGLQAQEKVNTSRLISPWKTGMSADEIKSFSDNGPYAELSLNGELESSNGILGEQKAKTVLTFDRVSLKAIRAIAYEGRDAKAAIAAALRFHEMFTQKYGDVSVDEVSVNGKSEIDRASLDAILKRVLGTARDLGADMKAKTKTWISMTMTMTPIRQPADYRIYCQWGYSTKQDMFTVSVIEERADVPLKSNKTIVQMDKIDGS